jgi:hypothetical protein
VTEYRVVADVSSDNPDAVRPVLVAMFGDGVTPNDSGFHIDGTVSGDSARDLNRSLLSELRSRERRTRLRSEWHGGEWIERFFDYVPKSRTPIHN